MAIYASPEEMVQPAGRSNRWTVTLLLTTFLAIMYFLQSQQAADHLVALQHVVVKNKSIRGIANRTGISFENSGDDVVFSNDDDETATADDEPVEPESKVEKEDKPKAKESEIKKEPVEVVTPPKADENNGNDGDAAKEQVETAPDVKEEEKKDDKIEAKAVNEDKPKEEAEAAKKEDVVKSDETPAQDTAKESNDCSSKCSSRAQQHKERWNGDLLDTKEVRRLVQEAHDKLVEQLKVDYGKEFYEKIFQKDGKSRGRTLFLPASVPQEEASQQDKVKEAASLKRLKRKLQMKVLAAQISMQNELESLGDCDCKTGRAKVSNLRSLETEKAAPPLADHHERFIWATGGHSSAAGHGNLFNESYTAFLERGVTDIFGSIGIEFLGRNYAMGGTNSGPEIALCSEAIFGTDVDVVSYDFCMTDGRVWDRKGMYANRNAGLNPNRPVIIDMFTDAFLERRVEELKKIEERGLAGFYMNAEVVKTEMKDGIPDTFGLNMEQINALPPFVRHFKCQDALEKGDPTCAEMKFDNDQVCPDRKYMNTWHWGWRLHALYGNAMALFLSETLLDAISEMQSTSDRVTLLRHLQNEENVDYQKFAGSDVPPLEKDFLKQIGDEFLNETDTTIFFRNPSICHTGRLPAQSRYLGILTESEETGAFDYFKGIPKDEADKLETQEEVEMPLVYDPKERQDCEVELNRDYKDFFFTSDKMGWTRMTIPNKAEKEAYGQDDSEYRGILVMCLKSCDWGKCPKGDMQLKQIQEGKVKFEVNGLPVANVTKFSDCGVLRGKQGHVWKPNSDGQYVLKAKVLGDGSDFSYLRISSLVLL